MTSLSVEEARLPDFLRALAVDCDNTDGWESASEDLRAAADLITRQAEEIERLESMITPVRKAFEAWTAALKDRSDDPQP